MTFRFEYEAEKEFTFDYETFMKQVMEAALDYVGCPYEAEINIVITDNKRIHEVNREYRDIDQSTDVLSFPMVEYETPGEFLDLEESCSDCFHPETGELLLGDIMISVDKVYEQAETYGHSVERELGFLTAHSILHLCGYDHMEEKERIVMEEKQKEILDKIGLKR